MLNAFAIIYKTRDLLARKKPVRKGVLVVLKVFSKDLCRGKRVWGGKIREKSNPAERQPPAKQDGHTAETPCPTGEKTERYQSLSSSQRCKIWA